MLTLVTGASGHLGCNLVRELLRQNRKVRVLLHDDDKSLQGLDIERTKGDVRNIDDLRQAMEGVSVVYHLVAIISIYEKTHDDLAPINIQGVENVVQVCLEKKIKRLVHMSSIHALSFDPKTSPIDETRELALDKAKHLAYDWSKAQGELRVLEAVQKGLDAVILNPVGVIGPNDFGPSATGEMLLQIVHKELPGLVQSGFNWVDVRDVAIAAISAETKGRKGERYILTSEYGTFKRIASIVTENTGVPAPFFNSSLWLAKLVAPLAVLFSKLTGKRPLFTPESIQIICCHQQIATTKAKEELDFHPRPLEETIHSTLDWFHRNGKIQTSVKGYLPFGEKK